MKRSSYDPNSFTSHMTRGEGIAAQAVCLLLPLMDLIADDIVMGPAGGCNGCSGCGMKQEQM